MNVFQIAGHLTFALIAISFLVKDLLWLRCLAVVASLSSITFNYFAPATPLWLVIYWNLAFISINVFQIVRLLRQRVGIRFTTEEKDLYENMFKVFSPFEFMKLLQAGKWAAADKGEVLIREKEETDWVMLIYNGIAGVEAGGRTITELKDGDFIGEISFIKGGVATATVRATEPTKYLIWSKANLKKLLKSNPSMSFALQKVISTDVVEKLTNVTSHEAN